MKWPQFSLQRGGTTGRAREDYDERGRGSPPEPLACSAAANGIPLPGILKRTESRRQKCDGHSWLRAILRRSRMSERASERKEKGRGVGNVREWTTPTSQDGR